MYCTFCDLLGFSALTRNIGAENKFVLNETPGAVTHPVNEDEARAAVAQSVLNQFYTTQNLIPSLMRVRPKFQTLFLDCGFVVFDDVQQAACYAIELLKMLLVHFIPARCGIAYGSFMIWNRDARLKPWPMHNSIFLGSAITRAASAESVKQKGLGIFIDDSALPGFEKVVGRDKIIPLENPSASCSHQLDWSEVSLQSELLFGSMMSVNQLSKENIINLVRVMGEKQGEGKDAVKAHYDSTVRMMGRCKIADVLDAAAF